MKRYRRASLLFSFWLRADLDLPVDLALAEVVQTLEPAHTRGGLFEREDLGPDDLLDVDFGEIGLEDFGRGIELLDDPPDT